MLKRLIQEEIPWFLELEQIEEIFQKHCEAMRLNNPRFKGTKYYINWLEVWEHLQVLKKSIRA
jgi:hypothetical protein